MANLPAPLGGVPPANLNDQTVSHNDGGTVVGSVSAVNSNIYIGGGGMPPSRTERPTLPNSARVFLSYKRNVANDELVAIEIYQALKQRHRVFIDQAMPAGTPWVEQITQEIFQADALIVLLSEHSVQSEMVQREIELARRSAAQRQGLPLILPVLLAYRAPFRYPLNEYLDPLQWAFWDG